MDKLNPAERDKFAKLIRSFKQYFLEIDNSDYKSEYYLIDRLEDFLEELNKREN